MNPSCLSPLLTLMWLSASASADDWPQWMGPQRDGVWRETGLIETFDTHGPPVKWRVPVKAGYVGPAVAEGKVFLLDREAGQPAAHPPGGRSPPMMPGQERVLCLDLVANPTSTTSVSPYRISNPSKRASREAFGSKLQNVSHLRNKAEAT